MTRPADFRTSRRIVFQGLGALGVAAALAGCGGGDSGSTGGSSGVVPESGAAVATTAEVPVGGGIVVSDANLVITQPTADDFKAFSSVCTHQGFPVTSVDGTEIICPEHGSRFSIDDGSAVEGPATTALEAIEITVTDGEIRIA